MKDVIDLQNGNYARNNGVALNEAFLLIVLLSVMACGSLVIEPLFRRISSSHKGPAQFSREENTKDGDHAAGYPSGIRDAKLFSNIFRIEHTRDGSADLTGGWLPTLFLKKKPPGVCINDSSDGPV